MKPLSEIFHKSNKYDIYKPRVIITKRKPAIATCKDIENKISLMLKEMTLEQKVGQMTEFSIDIVNREFDPSNLDAHFTLDEQRLEQIASKTMFGSMLNAPGRAISADEWNKAIEKINEVSLKHTSIPTIYGIDAPHGANYTLGSTLFPQEVNIAASFNRDIAYRVAEHTAYELRACNIPWVYAPTLDLARKASWPRLWECYSEDAYLSSEMGKQAILGLQGNDPNHIDQYHVGVCAKHYMAYGIPYTGQDRSPSYASIAELREKHFAPFKSAVDAGALSIMASSSSVNGIPMHANHELLTIWLKQDLRWDGVIVSDWADIYNLYMREKVAHDYEDAICLAINAGVDMVMVPYDTEFCKMLLKVIGEYRISMERIDDAVGRILRLKFRLGLIDKANTRVEDYPKFQNEQTRETSYRAAIESITLLKNEGNILPLKPHTRVLVTGPNANCMRSMCGGWSYSWQGDIVDKMLPNGTTIVEAMKSIGGDNVVYVPGVEYADGKDFSEERNINIDAAIVAAQSCDVIVVCIGENSYCETAGNIHDMNLSSNQQALAKAMIATGKPVVLLLNEGRGRIISSLADEAKGIIHIYLPGTEGGRATADILYGNEIPSGRLPYTYQRYPSSATTYDHKVSEHMERMSGAYDYEAEVSMQWEFGHGLSYTTFEYSNLRVLNGSEFTAGDTITIAVDITNKGPYKAKESVLLFINDDVASIVPDRRRLRSFEKIELDINETRSVTFDIKAEQLALARNDGRWYLEMGNYTVECGGLSCSICCKENINYGRNI